VMIQTFVDWLVLGLRWAHIVAILGWVGASLYFMWLDSKLRSPDPARENVLGEAWMGHGGGFYIVEKRRIASGQVPSPVYWFRVEAGITWITGFLLLVFIYYWTGGVDLVDAGNSTLSPGAAVGFAVALLPFAWIVYDRLWVSRLADNVALATVVSLVLLFACVYFMCALFTGRAAVIHIGAILGTNMVANVWTRIVPAQEEAVAATKAGRERNAVLATRARRRAIHNTYLTLPVIFTMIATHAPSTYGHPLNWLILSLLIVVGMAARHMMILFDRRQPVGPGWFSAGAPLAASLAALGLLSITTNDLAQITKHAVPFTVVRGIVDLRCGSCHSRKRPEKANLGAPSSLSFDTNREIAAHAEKIKGSVLAQTMPPHNSTRMTNEERHLIARWVGHGENLDPADLKRTAIPESE